MKRIGNLHDLICTNENIELADKNARKCKPNNWGVRKHDKHKVKDNEKLLKSLKELTYKTSQYSTFKIYEPKERLIFRLPYYPDRIVHHSIMNIMEPIWVKLFISNTYSCIKGRGIHKLAVDLKKALQDKDGTKYCLKLDIKKFYPSIDHDILKQIIRKKVKDRQVLTIMDEIIDSADGVPIGNYLSQFFANLYLTYFDHWLKEEVGIKYYFRYADDIVILDNNKEHLRNILILIKMYLHHNLNLQIKPNYQVFPVDSRGIDFVGYIFFHTHTLIRKSIKYRIFRLINKYKSGKIDLVQLKKRLVSYSGWLKYCNSKHLLQKIERDTGIHYSNWIGQQYGIGMFYDKSIKIFQLLLYSKGFRIDFVYNQSSYSVKSRSINLYNILIRKDFPINFKIQYYVRTNQSRDKCVS